MLRAWSSDVVDGTRDRMRDAGAAGIRLRLAGAQIGEQHRVVV
jgi:hypothetical protein